MKKAETLTQHTKVLLLEVSGNIFWVMEIMVARSLDNLLSGYKTLN